MGNVYIYRNNGWMDASSFFHNFSFPLSRQSKQQNKTEIYYCCELCFANVFLQLHVLLLSTSFLSTFYRLVGSIFWVEKNSCCCFLHRLSASTTTTAEPTFVTFLSSCCYACYYCVVGFGWVVGVTVTTCLLWYLSELTQTKGNNNKSGESGRKSWKILFSPKIPLKKKRGRGKRKGMRHCLFGCISVLLRSEACNKKEDWWY